METKNFYVALYKVDFIKNGKQNNVGDNKQVKTLQTFLQNAIQSSHSSFDEDVGAQEFYIFTYKCEVFIIIAGETYVFSGWNDEFKGRLKSFINQLHSRVRSSDL